MEVTAFEGIIENGQIRLKANISLPEKTKVYVIVPGIESKQTVHIYSPRLAHPEQATDFVKEVVEEYPDADL